MTAVSAFNRRPSSDRPETAHFGYATEVTPLAPVAHRARSHSVLTTKSSRLTLRNVETNYFTETTMILKSCMPLIVTFLLQYSLTVASVFSVGNMGSNELAAVTLSNLLANVTSYGIIQGIASSLSTLCPQSFGKRDYKAVGLQAMRCFIVLMLIYIPIFVFWFYGSYPLLSFFIETEQACALASQYLRVLVWGVPGFIIFEVLKQYLQAQGIFHASTYVLILCAPMNIILNYVLVWNETIGLGFIGAPVSITITNWTMALLLLFYATFIDGYQCWCGFSKSLLTGWGKLLSLAGPGVIMIEGEWIAFEVISFASSKFGVESLAAQSVVSTSCVTIYQIPFAVSVAASTRIAWFIGSERKKAAVDATKAALTLAVVFGVFNAVLLGFGRTHVASLFSKDPVVVNLAAQVLIIGAFYQVIDCLACVAGGILRGQGRQYIGSWISMISYYVLALPVAFFCGFHLKMELFGLWIGMVVALTFVSGCETFFVLNSDWDSIIKYSNDDRMSVEVRFVDNESIYSNNIDDETSDVGSLMLVPTRTINSVIDHHLLGPSVASMPISTAELNSICIN